MKVLIDTNVLLDVLSNRKEFVDDAVKIFDLCQVNKVEGYISALSIPNIAYILRKEVDFKTMKKTIDILLYLFKVVPLNDLIIKQAIALNMNDFEDAIQTASADAINVEFIISRNKQDFINSTIKTISPNDFLNNYFN